MGVRRSVLVSLSVAVLLLAFVAATQFRSQPLPASNRLVRNEALRHSVDELEARQRQLTAEVQGLQAGIRKLEDQAARGSSAAQAAKGELDSERELVGLVPLHGPGVTIRLKDAADPNDPTDRSLGWIVHYQDLQDLVNVLWARGAEAVSVNGQRVVPITSFFYAGVNVLMNNASRLSTPYTVQAIGDPSALEAGVGDPDQLAELKSRSRTYGLALTWQRNARVQVPAYDASFVLKYAQPIGS